MICHRGDDVVGVCETSGTVSSEMTSVTSVAVLSVMESVKVSATAFVGNDVVGDGVDEWIRRVGEGMRLAMVFGDGAGDCVVGDGVRVSGSRAQMSYRRVWRHSRCKRIRRGVGASWHIENGTWDSSSFAGMRLH